MPTIVEAHLTNGAYGFPAGKKRRVPVTALACIHVTGNKNTAAMADLHGAARAERNYANRDGSNTSAHYYIARDGWTLEAVDPVLYAAWSNGIVREPNRDNPGILDVLALERRGFNANEAYVLELEHLGYGSTYPTTEAQRDAIAELIAAAADRTGLPISRETVHGHWELNGVDRRNCPVPYLKRETFLRDIVARARALTDDTAGGGDEPMRDFTMLYNAAGQVISGQVTVAEDDVSYLDLAPEDLKPIAKGTTKQGVKVRLTTPIAPGKPATDDWMLGWLIGDNAAFVLDRNVTVTPYPAPPPAPQTYPVTVDIGGQKVTGSVELP
jgi:hypothetical protein